MTHRRGPEYGPLGVGSGFALIGGLAFTAACRAEIQATPTSEIFPTQSRAPEVIPRPTETLYVGVGMGQSEIIREVNGRTPPGAGGPISIENIDTVSLDDRIHRALLKLSLAPVHENRVISRVVNRPDGGKECYPIMPDVLFNPYLPEGVEERDSWLAANSTVVSYGDSLTREVRFKGLRTLSLRPTSKDVFCVSAVVNSDDNPFRDESGRPVNDGVVLNVLMDREGNIYGTLPGIYGANDRVVFNAVDNKVYVNGVEVWHVGDRMAELASTPNPTSTPEPAATPEGYLALEKIQELASSFICNEESCVRDVYRYPNFLDFDFISSGVFEEIELANPKTGELLGREMVLKAVSKDKNNRPFVVNILVQLEPVDNPGYNYLYGAAWTLIVAGSQEMDFVGEEILSPDEWSRFIPEGATYEIALLKRRAPDSDRISSDPVTRDLYYLFYDDPNYLEMLKAFYESNGEEVNENLILFISGSSDNTPKTVSTP